MTETNRSSPTVEALLEKERKAFQYAAEAMFSRLHAIDAFVSSAAEAYDGIPLRVARSTRRDLSRFHHLLDHGAELAAIAVIESRRELERAFALARTERRTRKRRANSAAR